MLPGLRDGEGMGELPTLYDRTVLVLTVVLAEAGALEAAVDWCSPN